MSFWGTSRTSRPRFETRSRGSVGLTLLLATTLATASVAQSYPAEIVEAKENGLDLEVRLVWLLDPDNPIPSNLVVYGESGQQIASAIIEVAQQQNAQVSSKSSKEAVPDTSDPPPALADPVPMDVEVEDVLVMLPENHLYLQIEGGDGTALSHQYPLVIRLGNEPGGGCSPKVEPRIETDAVLIDPELSQVLDYLDYENLDDALEELISQQPDLLCAIESLQADLARLRSQISPPEGNLAPAETCSYFWQAVIDGNLDKTEIYEGPYRPCDGCHTIYPGFAEVGGYTDRSSHCIQTRAQGINASHEIFEQPYLVPNQLNITFSTRRWTGKAGTCSSCDGTVRFDMAYSANVVAEVLEVPPPTEPADLAEPAKATGEPYATASASETAVFTTNDGEVFNLTVDANASTVPPLGDLDIALLTKGASAQPIEQPGTASLTVTGSTLVSSSSDFMARTEYQLDYYWWVYANSSCTALNDVSLLMSSIPRQLQPYAIGTTRIKLQRYP